MLGVACSMLFIVFGMLTVVGGEGFSKGPLLERGPFGRSLNCQRSESEFEADVS